MFEKSLVPQENEHFSNPEILDLLEVLDELKGKIKASWSINADLCGAPPPDGDDWDIPDTTDQ